MNILRTGNYLKSHVQSPTSNQTVTKKLLYYTFFTVVWCSLWHNTTQCFNNCQVAVTSRSEVIETKGMSANQYCNYCSTTTSLSSAMPGYKATLLPASPPPHLGMRLHCYNIVQIQNQELWSATPLATSRSIMQSGQAWSRSRD